MKNEIITIKLINIDGHSGQMSLENQVAEKVNGIVLRINQLHQTIAEQKATCSVPPSRVLVTWGEVVNDLKGDDQASSLLAIIERQKAEIKELTATYNNMKTSCDILEMAVRNIPEDKFQPRTHKDMYDPDAISTCTCRDKPDSTCEIHGRQTKVTAPKPVNPDNLPEDPDTGFLIDIFCSSCGENILYGRDIGLYKCTNCGQRYSLKELPHAS